MDADTLPSYARRLHDLIEPLCTVAFFAPEPSSALVRLGLPDNYWDGYFAGRAGPLGLTSAEVVDAAFYSFAPGEVARHIPRVWEVTTPREAADAVRQGCADALRRILAASAESDQSVEAADLLVRAAASAEIGGRIMFAALRAMPVPEDPVERLWHAATLLREHRGDGHVAALQAHRIGRTEAHVLLAIDLGMAPADFGRLHHLPSRYLDETIEGLRRRGLVTAEQTFTDEGRAVKDAIERLTDELAADALRTLTAEDRERLVAALEPLADAFAS